MVHFRIDKSCDSTLHTRCQLFSPSSSLCFLVNHQHLQWLTVFCLKLIVSRNTVKPVERFDRVTVSSSLRIPIFRQIKVKLCIYRLQIFFNALLHCSNRIKNCVLITLSWSSINQIISHVLWIPRKNMLVLALTYLFTSDKLNPTFR